MFLNRLDPDEKSAFLALAHHVARSDAEFSSEELTVIARYCMEMQVDDIDYDEDQFDIDQIIGRFQSDNHRNIVLLELTTLIYADERLAAEEQQILDKLVERFDMNPYVSTIFKEWAKSFLSLCTQGEALIHL